MPVMEVNVSWIQAYSPVCFAFQLDMVNHYCIDNGLRYLEKAGIFEVQQRWTGNTLSPSNGFPMMAGCKDIHAACDKN